MDRKFTLEYWVDDGWYVGRLKEVPAVFSQGATLQELEDNIADAYRAVLSDSSDYKPAADIQSREVTLHL